MANGKISSTKTAGDSPSAWMT